MRLCDGADAVVENYRGGVMDRLGLSYEALHARNPEAGLRHHPRLRRSAHRQEPLLRLAGLRRDQPGDGRHHGHHRPRQGHADEGRPRRRRHHARRSPAPSASSRRSCAPTRPAAASSSMSAWSTPSWRCASASCTSTPSPQSLPVPEGNHHPLLCPFGMFPAKDGFVTIAAHADPHFPILCRLIGRPEMATDPQERHRAGPPRQPGRDHRRGVGFHAAAHQAGAAEASRRPGAVLAGLRRARHRRRPALRGARDAALGAASRPRPRGPDRRRGDQDDRDAGQACAIARRCSASIPTSI